MVDSINTTYHAAEIEMPLYSFHIAQDYYDKSLLALGFSTEYVNSIQRERERRYIQLRDNLGIGDNMLYGYQQWVKIFNILDLQRHTRRYL